MNDSSGYELALLVSKRLRRRLLKASGILALVAIGFTIICLEVPPSMWISAPVGFRYLLVGVPILSIAGAAFGFASWVGISIRAAILGTAVDDVLDEAARRGLIVDGRDAPRDGRTGSVGHGDQGAGAQNDDQHDSGARSERI